MVGPPELTNQPTITLERDWFFLVARAISTHCCPGKISLNVSKRFIYSEIGGFHDGNDLKLQTPRKRCLAARRAAATTRDERWPHGVCATARASAAQRISQVRGSLRWRTLREKLFLLGSVFGYGLRATDLSREPAGHRNLLARGGRQTLSPGFSRQRGALDAGGRQRVARLENFCRLCANTDRHSTKALCPRSDGRRSGAASVRA